MGFFVTLPPETLDGSYKIVLCGVAVSFHLPLLRGPVRVNRIDRGTFKIQQAARKSRKAGCPLLGYEDSAALTSVRFIVLELRGAATSDPSAP